MANPEFSSFLKGLVSRSLNGEIPSRGEVIRLLGPDPHSPEAAAAGRAAREMARLAAENKGDVWTAIGIDSHPCSMNCTFCSLGEKWGIVTGRTERSHESVLASARVFAEAGATWITLRTTEFYPAAKLAELAEDLRAEVPGSYKIVVNTGELTTDDARLLHKAGIYGVYHSLRLREGTDTGFAPAVRTATLAVVRDSDLELAHLVEPVGPEHTNAEIADVLLTALEHGAALSGVMARVNVPGTPFAGSAPLDDMRLAQIASVTRLCGGPRTPAICVHPRNKQALEWGANVVVVETGAVPRDNKDVSGAWDGFTVADAKALLADCGYDVG